MTALNVGDRVVITAEKTDRLGFLSACKGTVIEKQTVQFDDETAVAMSTTARRSTSFRRICCLRCEDTKKPASHQSEDFMFFEVLLDSAEDAHPGSKQFYNLLIEAGLLHAQKQRDYGRSDDPVRQRSRLRGLRDRRMGWLHDSRQRQDASAADVREERNARQRGRTRQPPRPRRVRAHRARPLRGVGVTESLEASRDRARRPLVTPANDVLARADQARPGR
jgi:hypothetical protein